MEASPESIEQDTQDADRSWGSISSEDDDSTNQHPFERSIFRKRKRKTGSRDHEQISGHHVKRARTHLTESYLFEYNQTVLDTVRGQHENTWPYLDPSQIGISYWSSTEKERLFLCLERFGRSNLSGVTQMIRSKSELEILEYLNILERGAVEHELTQRRADQLIRSDDVPAAAEVSQELCNSLEQAADALCALVHKDDCDKEEARFPSNWLLTEQTPLATMQPLKDDPVPASLDDNNSILQAMDLLDVRQMLELSARVFMNSPIPSQSWQYIADSGSVPSMFVTTLIDLRSIVVAITKRLVSMTLFHAMTRLRSSDNVAVYKRPDYSAAKGPTAAIKLSDVRTAVQNLGLPCDSVEFWRDAPRRLGLHVHDTDQVSSYRYPSGKHRYTIGLVKAPLLSPDEVEYHLSATKPSDPDIDTSAGQLDVPGSSKVGGDQGELHHHQGESLTTTQLEDQTEQQAASPSQSSVLDSSNSEDDLDDLEINDSQEQAETAYLEELDARMSRCEEEKLSALLSRDARSILQAHLDSGRGSGSVREEEDVSRASVPNHHSANRIRKCRKDSKDLKLESWRTSAVQSFVPDWERYGTTLPETAFEDTASKAISVVSGMRRLRQKPPRLTRADFKGKIRSWSRSVSRGRSPNKSMPSQAADHPDNSEDLASGGGSRNGGRLSNESFASSRRSTRSASRARVDYSNNGLGRKADIFRFSPLDDDNSSDSSEDPHHRVEDEEQLRVSGEATREEQAEASAVPTTELDENLVDTRARASGGYDDTDRQTGLPSASEEFKGNSTSRIRARKGSVVEQFQRVLLLGQHGHTVKKVRDNSKVVENDDRHSTSAPTLSASKQVISTVQESPMPMLLGRAPKQSLWSPADDAQLRSAHHQGMTWAEIVQRFFPGKTPNACQQRFARIERQRRGEMTADE